MRIGTRDVGPGEPCYVIAEAGVNHNGRVDLAFELVDAAVATGADAVKFQVFDSSNVATEGADLADYQKEGETSRSQRAMLAQLELSAVEVDAVARRARTAGISFAATPFDLDSADLLDRLAVPFFKVSSGDLTYVQLLRHLASKRRPIILSTGMASLAEVRSAVRHLVGGSFALLHCVSAYPAPVDEVNLLAMDVLREEFGVPVGYSDHTVGIHVAVASVAMGACIVEKHLTLDQQMAGPDHAASLEPDAFREMVRAIRTTESARGQRSKGLVSSEVGIREVARRSVVAACEIPAGTILNAPMLACKRPGSGIQPGDLERLVGRRVLRAFEAEEALDWESVE